MHKKPAKAAVRRSPRSTSTTKKAPSRRSDVLKTQVVPKNHRREADIVGLVVLALTIALFLSALSLLGSFGDTLDAASSYLLGPIRYLVYLFVALISLSFVLEVQTKLPRRFELSGAIAIFCVAALNSAYHARIDHQAGALSMAKLGGAIGHLSYLGLRVPLGATGAVIVLILCMVAFGFDTLGHSPISMIRKFRVGLERDGTVVDEEELGLDAVDNNEIVAPPSFLSRHFGSKDSQSLQYQTPAAEDFELEPQTEVDFSRSDSIDQDVGGDLSPEIGDDSDAPEITDQASMPSVSSSPISPASPTQAISWKLPSPSLLKRSVARSLDKDELWKRGRVLQEALSTHKVETLLVGMTVGPTVTRYELELGSGVKVARVTALHKDIAYAMAAADVRILAPIPGRSAIGVEVPNQKRVVVALADVLFSPEAANATHPLAVGVGRDISGKAAIVNLAEMPHVLIAGATGSGKSSCLNSILTSILMRTTPDEVRLILVDPKRVELGQYNGVPHLLTPVVTNPKKAANALAWAVKEMERRYDMLSELGARDISGYNQIAANLASEFVDPSYVEPGDIESGPAPLFDSVVEKRYTHLPYILVVVDELNDLMMVAARDVEDSICRIAQMARAVGIHLVIATQRPSVDVITGLIKANVPSRMAFSVSSLADSRVILDQPGAERLIGKGDMLWLGASSSHPQRIQAPWVSEEEVRKVVASWIRQGKASYLGEFEATEVSSDSSNDSEDEDKLFLTALQLVVSSQLGSTSMLQRKLKVGFSRAGRLMDLLERRGIVGPLEGSKPRVVLMGKEEYENYLESRS